jgi:3-deoxy-D-manno-octulosonate 8-phosphate phosphatase (KDO 8-P phosphatase)
MKKLNLILDVDGVMTTGQFFYSADGKVFKVFGPHDADGLKMIKDMVNIVFITADKRGLQITRKRIVEDMGFPLELVPESERFEFVKQKYGFENTIFVGDGWFDVPLIKACKIGIAPQNARIEAKQAANYITPSKSGEGAVFDACLYIKNMLEQSSQNQ